MKKAKLILSALVLFAVIGGALAFKAKRTLIPLFYTVNTFYTTLGPTIYFATDPICITGRWATNAPGPLTTGYTTCTLTVTYLTEVGSTRSIPFTTYTLPDNPTLITTFSTGIQ